MKSWGGRRGVSATHTQQTPGRGAPQRRGAVAPLQVPPGADPSHVTHPTQPHQQRVALCDHTHVHEGGHVHTAIPAQAYTHRGVHINTGHYHPSTHVHRDTGTPVHIYVCAHTQGMHLCVLCVHTHLCTLTFPCAHKDMDTRVHADARTRIQLYTLVHTHARGTDECTHIRASSCTRTQAATPPRERSCMPT